MADQATTQYSIPEPPSNDVSPGILITVLILAITVILSASLYLLLKFLRRRQTTATSTTVHHHNNDNENENIAEKKNPLIDTLPLFPFETVNGAISGGDCAVCLSKFEKKEILRFLPICCHAFHVECIDTWINTNQSCPLCRSPIFSPDVIKFRNSRSSSSSSSLSSSSRSFRVEIGNVSRRTPVVENTDEIRRSYSISGSYDYIIDDVVSEVPLSSLRFPEVKPEPVTDNHEALAAEVGPRGGWLKEYLSQSFSSSSRTSSFRGSGRWFFTGSSRRLATEIPVPVDSDLETGQLGDEIGELFRWLSGV